MKLHVEKVDYQYWLMNENGERVAVFDSDFEDIAIIAASEITNYINEPEEKTRYFEKEGLIK